MEDLKIDCRDERTLRMLYSKIGRPALGRTQRLVSSSAAEEIVQDVFLKAWNKGMVFPNLRSAYAWVYRCCTNGAIDHLRNRSNDHSEYQETDSPEQSKMEEAVEARQIWKEMAHKFSPEEASVFVYRYMEGLSQEEVCEVMNISRRTVNRLQEKVDLKLEKLRGGRHVE